MKTIEERAREFSNEVYKSEEINIRDQVNEAYGSGIYIGSEKGYIAGATEQKEIMLKEDLSSIEVLEKQNEVYKTALEQIWVVERSAPYEGDTLEGLFLSRESAKKYAFDLCRNSCNEWGNNEEPYYEKTENGIEKYSHRDVTWLFYSREVAP